MIDHIGKLLSASIDKKLVDELLAAYFEAKRNYYFGGHRLSAVEGGRFCEAAFRILEFIVSGAFTPIGVTLNSDGLIKTLAGFPIGKFPDSIRLHIPRALRVIYDVRNKRDAAHLADGIDPNLQDSTLVISLLDWTLAELVRLYAKIAPDKAQQLVESLVVRQIPAIENFDGFLKVLKPGLAASDHLLLLLYERGSEGATLAQLSDWAHPSMRKNLKTTLGRLVSDKAMVHVSGSKYQITRLGMASVEGKKLHQ